MTTIQINVPDRLANRIAKLSVDRENFIIEILQNKINEIDKNKLLKLEYKLVSKENQSIMADFKSSDLENWGDEY